MGSDSQYIEPFALRACKRGIRVTDQPEQERLNFDRAVKYVRESGKAAFAAAPVFGDDDQTAEGARVLVIQGDDTGGHRVRFIAGPFFATAFAANEVLAAGEVPARLREMQFMPTLFSEDWLSDQIQVLIARLVRAAQIAAPEMPDYLDAQARTAAPEVAFPISQIGRAGSPRHGGGDS